MKPVGEYPSRMAAARAFIAEGCSREDLARRLGIDLDTLWDLLRELRRKGEKVPPGMAPGRRGLEISARTRVRYRLRDPDGQGWLHLSGKGLTSVAAYAWIGFAHQLAALRTRHPELKAFRAVEVQPDATRSARSNGPAGGMLRGGVLA